MRRAVWLVLLVGCNAAPVEALQPPPLDIALTRLWSRNGEVTLQGTAVGPDGDVLLAARHTGPLHYEREQLSTDRGTSFVRIDDTPASAGFVFDDVEVVRTAWTTEPVVSAGFRRSITVFGETITAPGGFDTVVARLESRRIVHITSPADTFVNGLAVDALDQIYVAGRFAQSLEIAGERIMGDGTNDAFVAKIDAEDRVAWLLGLESPGNDAVSGVAVTPTEGVYVTGTVDGVLDLGAVRLESSSPRPYLLEIDPFGVPVRGRVFDGDGSAELAVLAVDEATQALWIAGTFRGAIDVGERLVSRGQADILVLRFAPGLDDFEVARYGSEELDVVEAGAVDRYGRFWITGTLRGATPLGPDFPRDDGLDGFVAALRAPGVVTFRRRIGGFDDQVGAGVGTLRSGHVRFTFQTEGVYELFGAPDLRLPGVYLGQYPR
ncbi:MAG: hypothetical protein RMA76_17725 [Deltaproteobacteria bacterium]